VTTEETSTILQELVTLLGSGRCLTDEDSCNHFGRDWTRLATPNPAAVLLPESIAEVQQIIQLARRFNTPIVPSGGRTGLSGGAVAANGELVLALDRLNRIVDVDPTSRSITCEAGAITAQIQEAAKNIGLHYPVDFASSGSSQIGGNIATNAGGIQVIRYGMTRNWVSGLKVVTGTGELLTLNRGLLKNNTGLDFRHLMIGSEGILAVIVEATLQLCSPPTDTAVLVLGVKSMGAIMSLLQRLQGQGDLLAFEFFSHLALEKLIAQQGLRAPFDSASPFYVLAEYEREGEHSDRDVEAIVEQAMAEGKAEDAVVSQTIAQAKSLWQLRENISETIARWTPYKNDISATVSKVPELLAKIGEVVEQRYPDFEVVWYGHIGDGNLHLNILKPDSMVPGEFETKCKSVSEELFKIVDGCGGSVSAEHGVGLLKKEFLHYSRSKEEIALMKSIKRLFDPDLILNPGKVVDMDTPGRGDS